MKIAPYIEKLHGSEQYKSFIKEHSGAYMAAGFFVLDFENSQNVHQIDFYVPKEKRVAAFTLDRGITVQMLELMNSKVPEKLDIKTKTDLDALKGILQDEMKNRGMTEDIKKIIAVVQNIEGKKMWNLNCVLSGMEILRANVDDESQTVLKMDKSSIMDYVKKMPAKQLAQLQNKAMADEDPEEQIKKLDKLEEQIEQEKAALKKKVVKKEKK